MLECFKHGFANFVILLMICFVDSITAPTMTLNKIEKLGGLRQHRGSLPISVDSHRRGSMPLPYKHQLRRAQAVDELDWPSVHSGSSDSVRSSDSNPEPGAYKVMLVGDTGVGKTTLAGIFGGLKDTFPHEAEHPGDFWEMLLGCGLNVCS